jgi:hypothetical protein
LARNLSAETVLGQKSGSFQLENQLSLSQNFLDVGCVDGFNAALSKLWQQMTTIFSPFRHVGYFFIFNSFDEGIYQVV